MMKKLHSNTIFCTHMWNHDRLKDDPLFDNSVLLRIGPKFRKPIWSFDPKQQLCSNLPLWWLKSSFSVHFVFLIYFSESFSQVDDFISCNILPNSIWIHQLHLIEYSLVCICQHVCHSISLLFQFLWMVIKTTKFIKDITYMNKISKNSWFLNNSAWSLISCPVKIKDEFAVQWPLCL